MKRRVVTLLIFLLLGAIANVAVAWGCALRVAPCGVADPQSRRVTCLSSTAVADRAYLADDKSAWLYELGWGGRNEPWRLDIHDLASWGWRQLRVYEQGAIRIQQPGVISVRSGAFYPGSQASHTMCGWPLHALQNDSCSFRFLSTMDRAGGFYHRHSVVLQSPVACVLPALPIWPGFAINTLFYATSLLLLLAAPLALRRWRRIKRGLCPACAYPIGTSEVCTECGKPVKGRSVEPATS